MKNMVSRALARRQKNEKGFTLVELLVVVIVIGILAAVSVPIYLNQRKSAWNSNAEQDTKNAQVQVETAMTSNNGKLPFTDVITCNGGDSGTKVPIAKAISTVSDSEITCSPDVTITVTPESTGAKMQVSHTPSLVRMRTALSSILITQHRIPQYRPLLRQQQPDTDASVDKIVHNNLIMRV